MLRPESLLDPVGGSKSEPGLLRRFQLSSQNICLVLLNFHFQKCRDSNPRLDPKGGSESEPVLLRHFQLSCQNICLVLLNFHFQKCRDPNPQINPERRIRTEARFTPTFSIIFSKHLFRLFHYRLFNYAETLHLGQTHKQLQLTKCIYQIMPLYTHILMLFIFACFHFTNHLSYHNIHFQCNNSIHNSIYEI